MCIFPRIRHTLINDILRGALNTFNSSSYYSQYKIIDVKTNKYRTSPSCSACLDILCNIILIDENFVVTGIVSNNF